MFNFFGCLDSNQHLQSLEIIIPENYIEYSHKDPETKIIRSKIIKHQVGLVQGNFSQWKRMKFKTKDVGKLRNVMRNRSFVDFDFAHKNQSIGSEDSMQEIIWKRTKDVLQNPIFCSAETLSNFQKVSIPNKILKQALTFIYQTHPGKLKQLVSQDYSQNGMYEFKLFRNGIIQNVIIDDYIPTIIDKPLMCGPVKEKQIFAMMLEKAIAKVCGSYEQIPEELEEILEMIFCGPLRKSKIEELSDRETVRKTIENTITNKGVAGFMTKRQQKIRNFGLQENQLYNVINHHYVDIPGEDSVFLLELQGEKKFATWNGRFSHNDQIWEKVDKEQRNALFRLLKNNKSFFLPINDIVRIFDHLIAFDGTDCQNKDWIQATSEKEYPSYSSFEIHRQDNIFIRVSTQTRVRSTLILAKFIGKNQYQYVEGSYHPNTLTVELNVKLSPGKYIITVLHDWDFSNTGNYSAFISGNTHCSLQKSAENLYSNLLEIIFKRQSLALRSDPKKRDFFSVNKYYSVCNMALEIGIVYMHVDISEYQVDKLIVKIDETVIEKQKWDILEPHRNRKIIDLDKKSRPDVLLILKNLVFFSDQKRFFPSTAFKIIE